jgi:hypothetical protein
MRFYPVSIVLLSITLFACGQQTPTPSIISSKTLGTLEVEFDVNAKSPKVQFQNASLRTQGFLPDNAFQVTRIVSSAVVEDATRRLLLTKFEFINKTTSNFTNFTLYAYNQAANNIGGTAYKNVTLENGSAMTDTQIVRGMHAAHSMTLVNNSLEVDAANADFQAFRPNESQGIEDSARAAGSISANDDVLEFGYVARNLNGGRTIAPEGTGVFTLAVIMPKRTDGLTPRRGTGTYVLANEAITRVSRSFEESTSSAIARYNATPNASEIALIVPENDTSSLPGTSIFLSEVKLFAPTETPVITGGDAVFGPEGGYLRLGDAILQVPPGSVSKFTRFKLESLNTPPAPFPNTALQNVGTFRLSASTNNFYVPLLLFVPTSGTASANSITELYRWDGIVFNKDQIGTTTTAFGAFVTELSTRETSPGFTGSLTFSIGRSDSATLSSNCLAQNGTFNGVYCQRPAPAVVRPQAQARNFRFMSFNAGNAINAGPDLRRFGRPQTQAFFCLPYQVKLCSFADEERARNAIAAYQPDILAVQEVWHNYCNYNQNDATQLTDVREVLANYNRFASMPIDSSVVSLYRRLEAFYADRVCSRPNLTSTQMGRIVGHAGYAIRCTIAQDNIIANRIINGYECTALRRSGEFEFVDPWTNGDGPTRGQEQISAQVNFDCVPGDPKRKGIDTGFQIERVRLRGARGPLTNVFEIANAHLASPGDDTAGVCQANQLSALYNRQVSSTRKSLVVGDFNIDTTPISITPFINLFQNSAPTLNRVTTPLSTAFNAEIKPTAAWSFVSDPNQDTLQFVGFNAGLDHVLSNFATGTCARAAPLLNFDHLTTTCTLTGFESGTAPFFLQDELLNYPPAGTTNPVANPLTVQQVLFSFARKGVRLNYPTFLPRVSGSGQWQLALPDVQVQGLFYNQRCNSNRETLDVTVLTSEVLPYANVRFKTNQSGPAQFPRTQAHSNWCL